jgi:hypothetical protein
MSLDGFFLLPQRKGETGLGDGFVTAIQRSLLINLLIVSCYKLSFMRKEKSLLKTCIQYVNVVYLIHFKQLMALLLEGLYTVVEKLHCISRPWDRTTLQLIYHKPINSRNYCEFNRNTVESGIKRHNPNLTLL